MVLITIDMIALNNSTTIITSVVLVVILMSELINYCTLSKYYITLSTTLITCITVLKAGCRLSISKYC